MCPSETLTLILASIPWVLVLLGWIIVHHLTLNRDRRKEKRAIADQIIEKLQNLEVLTVNFHTSNAFDALKAEEISLNIERVIRSIQRTPMDEIVVPTSYLVCLRQAMTRKNFDISDFITQSQGSEILRNIRVVVDDLISQIESRKNKNWI